MRKIQRGAQRLNGFAIPRAARLPAVVEPMRLSIKALEELLKVRNVVSCGFETRRTLKQNGPGSQGFCTSESNFPRLVHYPRWTKVTGFVSFCRGEIALKPSVCRAF